MRAASRVRPLMPAGARWQPELEPLNCTEIGAVFARRSEMILEMATANSAVAIGPVTLSQIRVVKELGAFYCLGNPGAVPAIQATLPALVALDDALAVIETEAASTARHLMAAVVNAAREWLAEQPAHSRKEIELAQAQAA